MHSFESRCSSNARRHSISNSHSSSKLRKLCECIPHDTRSIDCRMKSTPTCECQTYAAQSASAFRCTFESQMLMSVVTCCFQLYQQQHMRCFLLPRSYLNYSSNLRIFWWTYQDVCLLSRVFTPKMTSMSDYSQLNLPRRNLIRSYLIEQELKISECLDLDWNLRAWLSIN